MKSCCKIDHKTKINPEIKRVYTILLLLFYTVVLLWVIVFKCGQYNALHIKTNQAMTLWERFTFRIIPFQDIVLSFRQMYPYGILAFFFNTICLLPAGMLLGFFVGKKHGLIGSGIFIMGVELFQFFSGWGGFDFTDVFMNLLGVYLGFLIFDWLYPRLSAKAINRITAAVLIIAIPLAVLVSVKTAATFPEYLKNPLS